MSDKNELTAENTPAKLLELAVSKDLDITKLEKLMEMVQQNNEREASKSFKTAMVGFQSKKPVLKKTASGYGSIKYCPLSKMQQAVDPILSEFGLSYRWNQEQDGKNVKITCIVSHIDGHTEETTLVGPQDDSGKKNPIQSIGSTVSYLNRYTFSAAFGLSSDTDDDGGKPEKPKKMELKPNDKNPKHWDNAVLALSVHSVSIEQIEEKYDISEENRDTLIDQAMDIIENKEEVNND